MKTNNRPENKGNVREEKKATIGTAAHDGVEGPKSPVKAEQITKPAIATEEGTLDQPKKPA
jgi:protein tyrosine phosphatase (PTP) superfamily phosphohydrolase (DUF442 family)